MSQTEVKAAAGFRAVLPGLELATLIQLTCARRERQVVRVSSYGEEGLLYSVAGRVVHAIAGELVGEEAVVHMLGWRGGDFAICDLPFPESATIQRSTDGLLALAAERANDCALDEVLTAPPPAPEAEAHDLSAERTSQSAPLPTSTRASAPPSPPTRASTLPPDSARPSPPPPARRTGSTPPAGFTAPPVFPIAGRKAQRARDERPTLLPPAELPKPRGLPLPPPPPPNARRPFLQGEPIDDPTLIASVRVDGRGALLHSFGSADHLAQLVAYIAHVIGLIRADFALDPFQALSADLAGLKLLIFQEAGDVLGLLMQPGVGAAELRLRLGV